MRLAIRVLTTSCAVALAALPLVLLQGGVAQATSPHALTVPAQVSATTWTTMPNPATANSANTDAGVSCVTSVFCMAVGNGAFAIGVNILAEVWNGTTWTSLSMPTIPGAEGGDLRSVSCLTTQFCVAVGAVDFAGTDSPLIEQWNGTAWSVVQAAAATMGSSLASVSCTSPTFCMAAGSGTMDDPLVDQWNGSTWTPTNLTNPTPLISATFNAVSCTSATMCMGVGSGNNGSVVSGLSLVWNGSVWSITAAPTPSLSDAVLEAVSCIGSNFCSAAGVVGTHNLVTNWNGSSWTVETVPTPTSGGQISGISCFSMTSCTAVGAAGPGYSGAEALTWDGQTWTQRTPPPNPPTTAGSQFFGVDCITNWACVAVGGAVIPGGPTFLPFEAMAPISRSGYRFVATDGGIFNYGSGAPFLGSMGGQKLNAPIVGMATMPAGDGYYEVASDGGVFNFGSAQFYGSTGAIHLNKPVVGMAVTPDGGGYWLVASDGGVFAYGDAPFYGSMGGQPLNKPIVGIAPTPNGNGYYEVASDGGIFSFPTGASGPPFLGSTGSITLNKPVVGMAVTPAGQYYLVASDGGIFSFPQGPSGPPFYGSTGAIKLNQPVIGMTVAAGGGGYYLGAADGGIFSFPSGPSGPPFFGSRGGQPLNAPIVGIAG